MKIYEAKKEELGLVTYTFVRTLEDYDAYGPISYYVDDKSINYLGKNSNGEYYKFACKRRYASDSDDPRIPSEYGVICFYFNPGEEYIYYIYLTDEEDYIIGETNRLSISPKCFMRLMNYQTMATQNILRLYGKIIQLLLRRATKSLKNMKKLYIIHSCHFM